MNITRLDHFTIRTDEVATSVGFYVEALGLTLGPRPAFRFPGAWLYADGAPLLHIVARTGLDEELEAYLGARPPAANQGGTGQLDHIAFRGTALDDLRVRLKARGEAFRERIVPELGEHQLFLTDPNGIQIEVIFPCVPSGHAADASEMAVGASR